MVKYHQVKKGFELLPRRWVVERTFAWLGRSRRLGCDDERLAEILAGRHWVAMLSLPLKFIPELPAGSSSQARTSR